MVLSFGVVRENDDDLRVPDDATDAALLAVTDILSNPEKRSADNGVSEFTETFDCEWFVSHCPRRSEL